MVSDSGQWTGIKVSFQNLSLKGEFCLFLDLQAHGWKGVFFHKDNCANPDCTAITENLLRFLAVNSTPTPPLAQVLIVGRARRFPTGHIGPPFLPPPFERRPQGKTIVFRP